MKKLQILNEDGTEFLAMQIEVLNPAPQVIVAILQALDALGPPPKVRAKRSDAGKSRKEAGQ